MIQFFMIQLDEKMSLTISTALQSGTLFKKETTDGDLVS